MQTSLHFLSRRNIFGKTKDTKNFGEGGGQGGAPKPIESYDRRYMEVDNSLFRRDFGDLFELAFHERADMPGVCLRIVEIGGPVFHSGEYP